MAVESGWSDPRAANPVRADIEGTRANGTMMRAGMVFAGRAVRGACPSLPLRRPEAAEVVFRGMSRGAAIR